MKLTRKVSLALFDPTVLSIASIVVFFAVISSAMLYSAANGDYSPWALKQGITFTVFTFVMLLLRFIKITTLYGLSYYIYGLCILSLVIAELIGYTTMGAQRWLRIGIINVQPSEVAKLGVILALSRYFHARVYSDIRKINFLIVPTIIIFIPAILIFKQPNLGTTLIVIMISITIYFASGVNKWLFIIPGIAVVSSLPLAWNFLHDYQKKRILTFLNPEDDLLGAGYNIAQSKIAIGAGGLFGKGFLKGSQNQLSFLPEKHTDFIFTLLTEEWGFLGFCIIMVMYMALLFTCYRIAFNSLHHFGKMIAIGVGTMIFLHVFINVGMISGLLPVVGTPIPLLSYGGSNLVSVLMGLGLILSVDKSSKNSTIRLY
ncbi:MAG: rod shape-determining protein RodA [Candidatus Midichloria mitochondrii]